MRWLSRQLSVPTSGFYTFRPAALFLASLAGIAGFDSIPQWSVICSWRHCYSSRSPGFDSIWGTSLDDLLTQWRDSCILPATVGAILVVLSH
jgi:hypothetical protein